MAYEEKVGHVIEVLEDGVVQVKRVTRVLKDGVEIAKQYHRHVLEPGADMTAEVDKGESRRRDGLDEGSGG